MSSTLEKSGPVVSATPDPSLLIERLPDSLKWPRVTAGFIGLLAMVFWWQALQPLHYTDVWAHVSYGKLIWETKALPATEPFLPLSRGIPVVDTAWLSQLVAYLAQARWGIGALQFLHSALITGALALMTWRFYRKSHNVPVTLAGLAVFFALNWQQFVVARPQLAGVFCCVALLFLLTARRWSRWLWLAIPALFAAWANLHGSFVVGLALLGCAAVGRGVDVLCRGRGLAAMWRDGPARRLLMLMQLSAVAVLLNPYGLALYGEVLTFGNHPNLQALIEWDPLQIRSYQGTVAALVAALLMIVYRLSPRRVSAMEVLALFLLGGAALYSSRMLIWFAVVAAFALAWNAGPVWQRLFGTMAFPVAPSPRNPRWMLVSLVGLWVVFTLTPFGMSVLHGKTAELKRSVAMGTPVGAAEYFRKHPPQGQIFNTYEWGDFLQWDGPPGLQLFVNSHAHLIPTEVWQHYLVVINVGPTWDAVLDRYAINTVVVDKAERGALIGRLKENAQWKFVFDDGIAVIFTRKQPL